MGNISSATMPPHLDIPILNSIQLPGINKHKMGRFIRALKRDMSAYILAVMLLSVDPDTRSECDAVLASRFLYVSVPAQSRNVSSGAVLSASVAVGPGSAAQSCSDVGTASGSAGQSCSGGGTAPESAAQSCSDVGTAPESAAQSCSDVGTASGSAVESCSGVGTASGSSSQLSCCSLVQINPADISASNSRPQHSAPSGESPSRCSTRNLGVQSALASQQQMNAASGHQPLHLHSVRTASLPSVVPITWPSEMSAALAETVSPHPDPQASPSSSMNLRDKSTLLTQPLSEAELENSVISVSSDSQSDLASQEQMDGASGYRPLYLSSIVPVTRPSEMSAAEPSVMTAAVAETISSWSVPRLYNPHAQASPSPSMDLHDKSTLPSQLLSDQEEECSAITVSSDSHSESASQEQMDGASGYCHPYQPSPMLVTRPSVMYDSFPSAMPIAGPSDMFSAQPSPMLIAGPSEIFSAQPSPMPIAGPSDIFSPQPSPMPIAGPSEIFSPQPSPMPIAGLSEIFSAQPSPMPIAGPSEIFSPQPSPMPIAGPSEISSPQPSPMPIAEPSEMFCMGPSMPCSGAETSNSWPAPHLYDPLAPQCARSMLSSELSSDGGVEDNEIIDSSDTQYAPASELTRPSEIFSPQPSPMPIAEPSEMFCMGPSMPGAGAETSNSWPVPHLYDPLAPQCARSMLSSQLSFDGGVEDNEIIDSSDTQYAPDSELADAFYGYQPFHLPSVMPFTRPSEMSAVLPSVMPFTGPSEMSAALPSVMPFTGSSEMFAALPSMPGDVAETPNSWSAPHLYDPLAPQCARSMLSSQLSSDGGVEDNEIIDSSDTQSAPASELTDAFYGYQPFHLPSMMPFTRPSEMSAALPSVMPFTGPSEMSAALPSAMPFTGSSEMSAALPSVMPFAGPLEMSAVLPSMPFSRPSEMFAILPSEMSAVLPSVMPFTGTSEMSVALPSGMPFAGPSEMSTVLPSVMPFTGPSEMSAALSSVMPFTLPPVMPTETMSPHSVPGLYDPLATHRSHMDLCARLRPLSDEEVEDSEMPFTSHHAPALAQQVCPGCRQEILGECNEMDSLYSNFCHSPREVAFYVEDSSEEERSRNLRNGQCVEALPQEEMRFEDAPAVMGAPFPQPNQEEDMEEPIDVADDSYTEVIVD